MNNNEERPPADSDEEVLAKLREAEEGESASADDSGLPGLVEYLGQFLSEMGLEEAAEQIREAAEKQSEHNLRMDAVATGMAMTMKSADETIIGSEFADDGLAWGVWKSKCGCLHVALPDGKGGWATGYQQLEEVATSEMMQAVVQGMVESGQTVLEVMRSLKEEGR